MSPRPSVDATSHAPSPADWEALMVPLGRAFARCRSSNRGDPAARLNWLPTPPILAAHRTTSHLLAPSATQIARKTTPTR